MLLMVAQAVVVSRIAGTMSLILARPVMMVIRTKVIVAPIYANSQFVVMVTAAWIGKRGKKALRPAMMVTPAMTTDARRRAR